jgi:hypothetical protein
MAICVPDGPLSSEFVNTAKNMILGYQMLLPGGGGGVDASDAAGGGPQIGMGVVGVAAAATSGAANGVASEAAGGQAMGAGGAKEGEEDQEEARQLVKVVDDIFKNYLEALRQVVREADGCEDVSPLVALLERWHDSMRGMEALMPQVRERERERERESERERARGVGQGSVRVLIFYILCEGAVGRVGVVGRSEVMPCALGRCQCWRGRRTR